MFEKSHTLLNERKQMSLQVSCKILKRNILFLQTSCKNLASKFSEFPKSCEIFVQLKSFR